MENPKRNRFQIPGTVEQRVKFEIPLDSPEYQAFLQANRKREEAREETGGPDPEAEAAYLKAVKGVIELGRKLYVGDRSNPILP